MAVNRRRPASGKEVAAAAAMEVVVAGGGRGGVVALAGRPAGLTGYTMAVHGARAEEDFFSSGAGKWSEPVRQYHGPSDRNCADKIILAIVAQ